MNARKILVDTSIWIDYLKNKSSCIAEKVDGMLTKKELSIVKDEAARHGNQLDALG